MELSTPNKILQRCQTQTTWSFNKRKHKQWRRDHAEHRQPKAEATYTICNVCASNQEIDVLVLFFVQYENVTLTTWTESRNSFQQKVSTKPGPSQVWGSQVRCYRRPGVAGSTSIMVTWNVWTDEWKHRREWQNRTEPRFMDMVTSQSGEYGFN